jgi:ketosteroid isomerase-like protein
MSEQQNVDLVKKGYEAFGRGDVEAMLGLFDPQIEWSSPGPADLPTAGIRRGTQQVAEFFRTIGEMFEFTRFEAIKYVAQGDTVVVLGESSARLKPANAVLNDEWTHVFTVRDGRIVRFKEYLDTQATVAALRSAQARQG